MSLGAPKYNVLFGDIEAPSVSKIPAKVSQSSPRLCRIEPAWSHFSPKFGRFLRGSVPNNEALFDVSKKDIPCPMEDKMSHFSLLEGRRRDKMSHAGARAFARPSVRPSVRP